MGVLVFTAILSFVLVVISVISSDKKESRTNRIFEILTILFALAVCGANCYKAYIDEQEKKEKEIVNAEINKELLAARDSLLDLKNEIRILHNKSDSIGNQTAEIKEAVLEEFKPFFQKTIDFKAKEIKPISGKLLKGMKIIMTRGNCQLNVAMIHNGSLIRVDPNNIGYWEYEFKDTGQEGKTYFSNESELHCSMEIEMYGLIQESEKLVDIDVLSANNPREINSIHEDNDNLVCEMETLDFSGSWQMVQYYDDCENNTSEINWEELIVYYEVKSFNRLGKYFDLRASKIGERYKGKDLSYSRPFPLETERGSIENCEILIPLNDRIEVDNSIQKNTGYIKLTSFSIENDRTLIYGEFYHDGYDCSGEIIIFNN